MLALPTRERASAPQVVARIPGIKAALRLGSTTTCSPISAVRPAPPHPDDCTAVLNALDRLEQVLVDMHMPAWWPVLADWEGRYLDNLLAHLEWAEEDEVKETIETAADAAGMTQALMHALHALHYGSGRGSSSSLRAFASAAEFRAAIVNGFPFDHQQDAVAVLIAASEPLFRSVSRLPELEAASTLRNRRKMEQLRAASEARAAATAAAKAAAAPATGVVRPCLRDVGGAGVVRFCGDHRMLTREFTSRLREVRRPRASSRPPTSAHCASTRTSALACTRGAREAWRRLGRQQHAGRCHLPATPLPHTTGTGTHW